MLWAKTSCPIYGQVPVVEHGDLAKDWFGRQRRRRSHVICRVPDADGHEIDDRGESPKPRGRTINHQQDECLVIAVRNPFLGNFQGDQAGAAEWHVDVDRPRQVAGFGAVAAVLGFEQQSGNHPGRLAVLMLEANRQRATLIGVVDRTVEPGDRTRIRVQDHLHAGNNLLPPERRQVR